MKRIYALGLICATSQIFAGSGDITFVNQNGKFDNNDSVSVQIIPSSPDNDYFFAKDIAPDGSKSVNSDQFQNSKKFSIFIADNSQSGTYRRCLSDIEYDPNSKPITIAVANTDAEANLNQCYCTIEGNQNSCIYPVTEYKKVRGQADIPW